jgi:hypothetical protein
VEKLFEKIDENGFLLSRQQNQVANKIPLQNKFQCISIVTLENEFVHVIHRKHETENSLSLFEIPEVSNTFEWIEKLKSEVANKNCVIV